KADLNDAEKLLPGTEFRIWEDKDGGQSWTVVTGEDGTVAFDIENPGTYKVQETAPPPGYYLEDDSPIWTFVVSKSNPTIEYDKEKDKFIKHYQLIGNKDLKVKAKNPAIGVSVTKGLKHNSGDEDAEDFVPTEATFYIALFSDEELTDRVSNAKELSFKGEASSTVSFDAADMLEGKALVAGETYYVGETDADGTLLDYIEAMTIDGVDYKVEMSANVGGEDYAITIGMNDEGPVELLFDNIVYDPLPPPHKYTSFTVTKKVVDSDGDAMKYSGTFYVTLFNDAAKTDIYKIIPVRLKNQTQATVELNVGEGKDIVAGDYWLAETDANGKVVDSKFKFTPSFDMDSFTITDDESINVTLTNKAKPGDGPKTGDQTNLPLPIMLMILAMTGAGVALFAGRRRRQDD
ncbi:MAG: LPXTG cell wall anchor domain-containing protein, partial [Clostridia bacterium]|nr:LPXTG cell wall anchor domain-containing protein [Clostridia bacterium]